MDDPTASKRPRLDERADVKQALEPSTEATEMTFEAPPDRDSPLHILNSLNDHCLQEIFKRIGISDLSRAADVCTRFKRNAEEIFSLCHEKRFRFVSLTLVKPEVLRNFIHLIKSVYLNGSQASGCLQYINEHSNIHSLHLRSADVDVEKLKPLLPKLTSLEISSCQFVGDASDLFSFCSKLQYLKVKLSMFRQFSPYKIQKLRKFECEDYVYTEVLRTFIETNSQLVHISVSTVNKVVTPIDFRTHLLRFGNFKSMDSLILPCFQCSVTPLIASLRENNIPMKQLDLINCRIDDVAFGDLFQMKSIKILSLFGIEALCPEQFLALAKELPELEVLRLETPDKRDLKITIDDIRNFVQHSKKLYLLTIGIINGMTIDTDSYNDLLVLLPVKRKPLAITIIYENFLTITVPKQTLIKYKPKIRIVGIKYDNYNYAVGNTSEESDDDDDDDDDDSGSSNASEDDSGSDVGEDSDDSSDFDAILGSADESDDNSDDNWLNDVYK